MMGAHLGLEDIFLLEHLLKVPLQFAVPRVEQFEVALQLFRFPACTSVLEPDRDLAGLQSKLLGQFHFPVGLELDFHFEVAL